jgi:hypothetical protein
VGAHIELQTIRAVLTDGTGAAIRAGVRADLFSTIEGQVLWEFLFQWYHDKARYGTTPSIDIIKERFKQTLLPERADYPLGTLVTLLTENKMQRVMLSRLPQVLQLAAVDPMGARKEMASMLQDTSVGSEACPVVDLAEVAYEHVRQEMALLRDKKGTLGFPFPWEPMTTGSNGACPGKSLLVMAPPKTGKSMVCLYMCAHFYWYHNARVMVFCGKEMGADDVLTILACMITKTSLERYWKGEISKEEGDRCLEILDSLREETKFGANRSRLLICEDLTTNLEAAKETLLSFQPDISYYDALYSAAESLRWEEQSQLVTDYVSLGPLTKAFMMASWQSHIREAKVAGIEDQTDYAYTQNIMAKTWLTMKLKRRQRGKTMECGFPATRKLCISPFRINYTPGVDMGMAANQHIDEDEDSDPERSLW